MSTTHILNIGISLNGKFITAVPDTRFVEAPNIFSEHNIRDADILFWNVKTATFPYQQAATPQMFSENKFGLNKLKVDFEEFFQLGRTLVLPSPNFFDHKFYVTNDQRFEDERHLSFINVMPLKNVEVDQSTGSNVVGAETAATKFLYRNSRYLQYSLIFKNIQGTALMFVKGSKAVVSQYIRYKDGLILLFPDINLPNNSTSYYEFFTDLYQLIYSLNNTQKPSSQTIPLPSWATEYLIEGEDEQLAKLHTLETERVDLDLKITNQKQTLLEIDNLKFLFAGDGEELERAVEFVLLTFGFDVQ